MENERFLELVSQEVELNHPWVKEGRIPVIYGGMYARMRYEVALLLPSPNSDADEYVFPKPVTPTAEEAGLVADYINYRRNYYNQRWQQKMLERPVDVDSTTRTVYLTKTDHGWVYRRDGWEQPFAPHRNQPPYTLEELLDHINSIGDTLYHGWEEWKQNRTVPVLPELN